MIEYDKCVSFYIYKWFLYLEFGEKVLVVIVWIAQYLLRRTDFDALYANIDEVI